MSGIEELRVLHVASGDLWGGAESQIHALLSELTRAHANIKITAAIMNAGELADRLRALPISVVVLDEKRQSALGLLLSLTRLINATRPHLVHTHRQKENVLGSLAAMYGRAVSLRTVHGAPEFTLGSAQVGKRLFRVLNRVTARYLQAASVAVSEELASRLPRLLPGARVEVVENGIDVQALRAAVPPSPADSRGPVRICFVGRLVPVKRIDVFLQVASRLECRKPGAYEFHVFGDGPLRSQMEQLAERLSIKEICRFHGFVKDVAQQVAHMDVLLLTSDHEGLPMTALEALALGVPVVAHGVGGLPELLDTAETGAIVRSQDADAFADAIETAYRAKPCVPAPSLLPARYQIDFTATKYAQLYRALARHGR